MRFVRYGSLVAQDHDISVDWFHTPPVKRGFYAFPDGYVEGFLLSGIGKGSVQNGRFRYLRDDNGNKVCGYNSELSKRNESDDGEEWALWVEEIAKKRGVSVFDLEELPVIEKYKECDPYYEVVIENKPTKFEWNGLVWSHFEKFDNKTIIKPGDVIQRTKYWVLTEMSVYKKALKIYEYYCKMGYTRGNGGSVSGVPLRLFDKDSFEVYIEDIQSKVKTVD